MLVMNCFSGFGWSRKALSWSVALEGISWVSRWDILTALPCVICYELVFLLKSFHCWQAPFPHPSEGAEKMCVYSESLCCTTHTPKDLGTHSELAAQKINKKTDLNNTINQLELTGIYETLCPPMQNAHSSQVHMEHSTGQATCQAIKQGSIHLKDTKS